MSDTAEDPLEGVPELWTKDGVYDWVERRVKVAQPEEEGGYSVADLARRAEWHEKCHHEEGEPTDDEGPCDDGECLGRLSLPFCFEGLSLGVPLSLGWLSCAY